MRKLFLLVVSIFTLGTQLEAQTIVNFDVQLVEPTGMGHTTGKSPIQPPTVYIEDYTLMFAVGHPEYILYIKDENDVVVYSTVVTTAETLVTLPSTLSGEYKIELMMDNWLFTGWIDL